jgi:hypothetical protein
MSTNPKILNKIDLSALNSVINSNGQATRDLIQSLVEVIEKLSNADNKPSVNVNMDVERIIKSMPQPAKQEAPVVNMNMDALKEFKPAERKSESYRFDIQRDGHGRIKTVIANPVGVEL